MRRSVGEYRVGIGSSSVLMVLVVLALAALSLLSLGSARSNAALSDRTLTMTLDYYRAAAQVQRMLGAMDELEKDYAVDVLDAEGWNALLAMHGLEKITVDENGTFAFSLDAGTERLLVVEGTLTPDSTSRYLLTRHELTTGYETEDLTLQLLIP